MDVKKAIENRRSYRSLEQIEVTEELITDLAQAASLAPSCYNKQPWRYVFVEDDDKLTELHTALADGNDWAKDASLLVAIFSQVDLDCVVADREYYMFDVGLSVQNMVLRATELGLATHLMAGYDAQQAKEILDIPQDMELISLLAVSKQSETINPDLSSDQVETEKERPARLGLDEFVYKNNFSE